MNPLLAKLRQSIPGLEPLGETSPPASSGVLSDEAIETYRRYRKLLIEAENMVQDLHIDFTTFDFDDTREQAFNIAITDIADKLEDAADLRYSWFNARVTLTEGGAS